MMGKGASINEYKEFERRVLETVKACQQRKEPMLVWAMEVSKCVAESGGGLRTIPSPELGDVVVSQLCSSNNNPSLWKFLHQALSCSLLYPLHVLSLLTSRVIPHRQSQPGVYRLYLELLRRHAFSFNPLVTDACKDRIIKSIDDALQLSQTYGIQVLELGHAQVFYFFSTVFSLIDSIGDDCGLQMTSFDGASGTIRSEDSQNMDVDFEGNPLYRRNEQLEHIRRTNSFMALEVLAELMENEKAVVLLRLIHLNMPEKFNALLQRMQFLDAHKFSLSKLNSASHLLTKLSANIQKALVLKGHTSKRQLVGMLTDVNSCFPGSCCTSEAGRFACWVYFDICMENAMDGKHFPVTSAINILAETIRTLQVFNGASWQETFLALWLSALRFVQRERDPLEGPIPHLESRLCVLLSIAPLAVALVLEDDSTVHSSSLLEGRTSRYMETGHGMGGTGHASRKQGLISSLQVLGMYTALLCPPASVVSAANNAVAKAVSFISKTKNGKSGINAVGFGDTIVKAGGDMRHLIVEACIARKLIDTSAYFWLGYVSPSVISQADPSPLQRSPWSVFMEGAPLTASLTNALVTTPASSLAEIEKLYNLALNGPEEERSAAAKILCGASLSCGWNIQEHVVHAVVKLLSPPVPSNFIGSRSHLIDYMPMLSSILFGATKIDTVHILSLHGVVPEVAAALFPLCEAFGSLVPLSIPKLGTYDESSVYMVFSSAFLFLLRLWKYYRPRLEQCITGRGGVIGGELSLEYLLLLRNSRIQSFSCAGHDEKDVNSNMHTSVPDRPIYIESCPKLRAWYCQNKSCMASTLSGLSSGNPVHQVANKILNMIYGKMTKRGTCSSSNTSTPSSSTISDSPSITEDACQIPLLPAWELMEAIPYVLEAILTACAHGRLSSRDMTTGLRDLVDFLPASLAPILSYFSAEVTRGVWKPVLMNGTDWPSPAANFASIVSEIGEILSAAGVNIPSCSSGDSQALLPLPMAALVSLTITFKLDKNLEYIHAVVGPALENNASSCPWPGMPVIGSLWTQKVRRWHDFIVVSCSHSVFSQNQEAVSQLLRSCFTSFLGPAHPSTSPLMSLSGVNGLLGPFISSRGVHPPVAPGFLYLLSCRTIHNVSHLNNVIVGLVSEFSRELVARWAKPESRRLKSTRASLALATARAKEVATLGASLLCVAGGLQLVQELYKETMPTWLLSRKEERVCEVSVVSKTVEGYAMAYLVVLSGALVWGVGKKESSWALSRSSCVIGVHMDFMAGVLDGNISLGCDPATWKAYVSCLVGWMVNFTPAWVQEVKLDTLRKVANGLKGWHECELAVSLLERGGPTAMSSVAEMLV